MSTKAPKAATFVTAPSNSIPGVRSANVCTLSANFAVLNCGRGSRPGFSSSERMSVTVGSPNFSSVNSMACRLWSTSSLPISFLMSSPVFFKIRSTTGYDSGCTAEASKGLAPSGIRKKPAACSKVFAPKRGTFSKVLRSAKAPLASR